MDARKTKCESKFAAKIGAKKGAHRPAQGWEKCSVDQAYKDNHLQNSSSVDQAYKDNHLQKSSQKYYFDHASQRIESEWILLY